MAIFDLVQVDKFKTEWNPQSFYNQFNIRAIIRKEDDMISQINLTSIVRRRLTSDIGPEGNSWFIAFDYNNDRDELYMKNSGILLLWKLQDYESFDDIFEQIEQHKET